MQHAKEVAILGAGIAGSTLAKAMADRGWDTVLFDRKIFPRHKVCGEFFSPESQSMLAELGLREVMDSLQPSPIEQARLISSRGDELTIPLPGTALGISRYSLDVALHNSAASAGVQVVTGTTVTKVEQSGQGYMIETRQGEARNSYRVRAVIAAWGANGRSAILDAFHEDERDMHDQAVARLQSSHQNKQRSRQQNSGQKQADHIGVKSHYGGIEMEPVVELYFFDGGYVGLSPVEGGVVNVAALLKRAAFGSSPKKVSEWIDAACARNSKLQQRLASGSPLPGTQAAVAPVDLKRNALAWDILPQVGDATVMIPPLCGDGMSMALRSAQLCAPIADRYLKGEISLSAWQHEYSRSLHQEFKGPLRWGKIVHTLLDLPVISPRLLQIASRTPGLAYKLVQATRLRERDA